MTWQTRVQEMSYEQSRLLVKTYRDSFGRETLKQVSIIKAWEAELKQKQSGETFA